MSGRVEGNRRWRGEGGGGRRERERASKQTWCLTSTETTRLIGDGEMEVGEEGDYNLYLSLHSHHQNDSCIKMGSDESRFYVPLIVRDKVTRQCPQTTSFF